MKGGEKNALRIAKQRNRDSKDIQHVRMVKDANSLCVTDTMAIKYRWKTYFEKLMNVENNRQRREQVALPVHQEVDEIMCDEVINAVRQMKTGKAVGPDNIPSDAWLALDEIGAQFLTQLFNRLLMGEEMPAQWRQSILVPIYKNKGEAHECGNYRGIKLLSHTMKIWERVLNNRIRQIVNISDQQFGFMPGKGTTDPVFALRMLMEKYREGQKELHCVFIDLEKAYDRVPREELWHCMRASDIPEPYVRAVHDMYQNSTTVIKTAVGTTDSFNVGVGLHQGSALSPVLFALIMDRLTDEIREDAPWTMLFADDIVLIGKTKEEVQRKVEKWREMLEKRGMKVSRSKTEYMCFNGKEEPGDIRLEDEVVPQVENFKYLGCVIQSDGNCNKEIKKKVQAGWNSWKRVSGVICDNRMAPRIKGRIYQVAVRPAMIYGMETLSMTKRQEMELETAEMSMLRFSLGVTRMDRITNERIRGTAHTSKLTDKIREARLRWYGHIQRRDDENLGRRMLKMELPGHRRRGRPQIRYMDMLKEDMETAGLTSEMAENRHKWGELIRGGPKKQIVCCGNPEQGSC